MDDAFFINDRFKKIYNILQSKDIIENLVAAKNLILNTRKNNNKIIFAGNGASATIASHGALDFMSQLAVKSYCINDPNVITAYANDFGYENFMKRYVQFTALENDLLILISSSGESQNVVYAAQEAINKKCNIITLSGFKKNNSLYKLGHINLWADSTEYNIVECVHNSWLVTICDLIVKDEQEYIGVHGVEFED